MNPTPMPPRPPLPLAPPMLTAAIPGVGGRIKLSVYDFVVEELPSYEPCGEGEHLYLWVEKRGLGPEFLTRRLAQILNIPVGAIGVAGQKDRHSVSRQWVSVPLAAGANLARAESPEFRILKTSRHGNKLKPGHSRGNRFDILIRGADQTKQAEATQILAEIEARGLPNYYGPQRFGRDGSTAELGFQCLYGKQPRRVRPFLYKFALSAMQSVLFNDYLAERVADNLLRTVLPGDVLMKLPLGGLFVSTDPAADQPRLDAKELVSGGPMFGTRTFAAEGEALRRELAVLARYQLSAASFAGFGQLMGGTRRHNLVYPGELSHEWQRDGLRVKFTLPSGSYATVLLRELMKTEPVEPGDDGADE